MGKRYVNSIVVLNDSLAQALMPKSKDKKYIMAYYIKNLLEKNGYDNVQAVDCGSLSLNKQHNITEFLKNNLSVAEIKATQLVSMEKACTNPISELGVKTDILRDFYTIDDVDHDVHISDVIKNSDNAGVVLSCVANDLMNAVRVSPVSYTLDKIKRFNSSYYPDALKRAELLIEKESFRDTVIDGYKRNIEQVLGINNNAKICLFGIYKPHILPNDFKLIFDEIDYKLQQTSIEYGQSFVSINDIKSKFFDFHPNTKNDLIIFDRVGNELLRRFNGKEEKKEIEQFTYCNGGLKGAINDCDVNYLEEQKYVDMIIERLIKEGRDKEEILKYMDRFIVGRPEEILEHKEIYKEAEEIVNRKTV